MLKTMSSGFHVEVQLKEKCWQAGRAPLEFVPAERALVAHSFVYALSMFRKFLTVLAREEGVKDSAKEALAKFDEAFPAVSGIRNSLQHAEDRARRKARNEKALDIKSVSNEWAEAPSGALLVLSGIVGSKVGTTMADGEYGEVDISEGSMRKVQEILQKFVDSLCWTGPKRHLPSM